MAVGPQETTVVPWAARALSLGAVAVCVTATVSLVVWGRAEPLLRSLPALGLATTLALVLFWFPLVRLDPARLTVINPFRTWSISWPAIVDLEDRWSLRVETATGAVTAWSAPREGMTGAIRDARNRRSMARSPTSAAPGRQRQSASALVQRQWEAYREAGLLGAVENDGVSVRWHVARLTTVLVLTALTLVGALWP